MIPVVHDEQLPGRCVGQALEGAGLAKLEVQGVERGARLAAALTQGRDQRRDHRALAHAGGADEQAQAAFLQVPGEGCDELGGHLDQGHPPFVVGVEAGVGVDGRQAAGFRFAGFSARTAKGLHQQGEGGCVVRPAAQVGHLQVCDAPQ